MSHKFQLYCSSSVPRNLQNLFEKFFIILHLNAHINCSLQHNGKLKTIIDISWQCRHCVTYVRCSSTPQNPMHTAHIRTAYRYIEKVNHTEIYGFLKVSSTKIIQCIVFMFYLYFYFILFHQFGCLCMCMRSVEYM